MNRVVIFQYRLLHYRVQVFNQLRSNCAERGIQIELVHGQASRREATKKDEANLSWAHAVRNRFFEVGERDLVWMPFPKHLRDCDLVIVMQENRILSNYPLLASRFWSKRQIAYWGHGKNFQSNSPDGLRERWKAFLLGCVDWWFAYTKLTEKILEAANFPHDKITCLNNAIDSDGFVSDITSISEEEKMQERMRLGIEAGRIGLFCGSLYPDKKLDLLIDASERIRHHYHDFTLIVVGDGPSMEWIKIQAQSKSWLKILGVKTGRDKALAYSMASVVLNPGAVGLHIVDSFCAGVPLVTTTDAKHGPEIAYLEDGVNGRSVSGDAEDYASAVLELLGDSAAYTAMVEACKADAKKYTLNNMVENFANGIEACLRAANGVAKP